MRQTVTVTMVGVLIGIVVVTLFVQFFCLEISTFPPPPDSRSFASQALRPFAVRKMWPQQPVVLNTGINVLVEISFCIKSES
jgi:hypothetical protein